MLPTFDFSNIVKWIARTILFTVRSPSVLMGLLAAIVAFYCIDLRSIFGLDAWLDQHVDSILSDFQTNAFVRMLFYMFNVGAFLDVFSASFGFLSRTIPAILSFFAAYLSFTISYRAAQALRETVKDIIK